MRKVEKTRCLPALLAPAIVTFTAMVPAQAQIDYIGARADAQRMTDQMRRNQKNNKKKGNVRRPKKTTQIGPVERYPKVWVNNRVLKSTVPATQANGHTFVPFRDIFEALGATVAYNQQKRLITAQRGDLRREFVVPTNAASAQARRQSFQTGKTPFIRNGTTMVPLRMVSELMGDQVHYAGYSPTPQITITSRAAS